MSVDVSSDPDALAERVAGWMTARMAEIPERAAICLAGGSTPERLYRRLAQEPYLSAFPWPRVHWFFGDERFVPHDDPRSNVRMWREALGERAPTPAGNVHAMPYAGTPQEAARAYENELQRFYGSDVLQSERPLFDVTLLGLGADGHTASLFPGTAALSERTRWVAPVIGAQPEPRLTLTYPVLESSCEVAFLVSGASKREILARVLAGEDYPATHLRPIGRLTLFVDRDAVGESQP